MRNKAQEIITTGGLDMYRGYQHCQGF